jgi:hypothetical protein
MSRTDYELLIVPENEVAPAFASQRAEQFQQNHYRQTTPCDESLLLVDCASHFPSPFKKIINTFRSEWAQVLPKDETTGSSKRAKSLSN